MSDLADLVGFDAGTQVVEITDRDAMLYALAVGATDLDLVWERDLRVLPTLATALGLWAVERVGDSGFYDRTESLHVTQTLAMSASLESGPVEMAGRVAAVWDKGKATTVEIVVESDSFTAGYTIYLPGLGGWGGEPGLASERVTMEPTLETTFDTREDQALLYRLTGDRHPVHVDPEAAAAMGLDRPILHGLCTLGIAARELAGLHGAHPADLTSIEARLSRPVYPGDSITIRSDDAGRFDALVGESAVLVAGSVSF